MVNTQIWIDPFVVDLDRTEKLLWVYLLTNPNTNIAGIYEISIRQIAFDLDLDKKEVQDTLIKFAKLGKIFYKNGWIALTNWLKHQSMNPKVVTGVGRIIENLPEWLKKDLIEPDDPQTSLLELDKTEPIHSLSKPIALNLTKLNLTKPNGTAEAESSKEFTPTQKRNYAKAVRADEAQAERAQAARSRPANSPSPFDTMRDNIKSKGKS